MVSRARARQRKSEEEEEEEERDGKRREEKMCALSDRSSLVPEMNGV